MRQQTKHPQTASLRVIALCQNVLLGRQEETKHGRDVHLCLKSTKRICTSDESAFSVCA